MNKYLKIILDEINQEFKTNLGEKIKLDTELREIAADDIDWSLFFIQRGAALNFPGHIIYSDITIKTLLDFISDEIDKEVSHA